MGIFEMFPYVNMHEMNLDWIIREVKALKTELKTIQEQVSGGNLITFDYEYNNNVPVWYCNKTFTEIVEMQSTNGALPMAYFRGSVSANANRISGNIIRFYFPVAFSAVGDNTADLTGIWIDINNSNEITRTTIRRTIATTE